jgi:hypothetical protein
MLAFLAQTISRTPAAEATPSVIGAQGWAIKGLIFSACYTAQ